MTEIDYTILDLLSSKRFECNRINCGLVELLGNALGTETIHKILSRHGLMIKW